MKTKEMDSNELERCEEICNKMANDIFEYALTNGATDVPMVMVFEMFLMLASKVGYDILTEMNVSKEQIVNDAEEIFELHLDGFVKEEQDNMELN